MVTVVPQRCLLILVFCLTKRRWSLLNALNSNDWRLANCTDALRLATVGYCCFYMWRMRHELLFYSCWQ